MKIRYTMNKIWEDWLVKDTIEEPKVYNTWILRISVKLVNILDERLS